jgi:hypothetical protein
LAFAVRVDAFAEFTDDALLFEGGGWEWEFLEANTFVVTRIVSNSEATARRECPSNMDST